MAPSALLLSTAAEVCRRARAGGLTVDDWLAGVSAADLALLAVGPASAAVSPYNPDRDAVVAALRASDEVAGAAGRLSAWAAAASRGAPLDAGGQTWLNKTGVEPPSQAGFSEDMAEFPALATKPRGGLWTSTALPGLASVWLTDEPMDWPAPSAASGVSAWRPVVSGGVRCYEIASRADWVALCERFPRDTTGHYSSSLRAHALAPHWSPPFVTPDWRAVREAYDAVHLQWLGYLDADNEVVPVPASGGTTCLSGWGSESTLWLRWVFESWVLRPTSAPG